MTDSVPLTRADMRNHADLLSLFGQHLSLEFRGLSPLQVNDLAFARLTKPDPVHLSDVELAPDSVFMLGTDQRDAAVPKLSETLLGLPANARVLDIGSGDGLTTRCALEGRTKPLRLFPLDPLADCLQDYRRQMSALGSNIFTVCPIESGIDEFIAINGHRDEASMREFDSILSIHSIYFTSNIKTFFSFALDRLAVDGDLCLVFSLGLGHFTGSMVFGYLDECGIETDGRLHRESDELKNLVGVTHKSQSLFRSNECQAALEIALDRNDFVVTELQEQKTRVYGNDLGDIIAFAFINALPFFDEDSMERKIAYVAERLQSDPESFDLRIELRGPRARMISAIQPQLYLKIKKL